MDSLNCYANIMMCKTKQMLRYGDMPMLKFSVFYPKAAIRYYPFAQNSINNQIQSQVAGFMHYVSNDLYYQAIDTYNQSQENSFPFRRYEAALQYTVTYNQNCHLSLYADQYEYAGGAHGNTVRTSNTWDLASGHNIPLSDFFPVGQNYRSWLIAEMTKQADEKIRQNPGIFFENYPALIAEYFNKEHYYLTPRGIAIYYQQYEIAPYSTGIVVFTIPYMDSSQFKLP